MRIVNKALLREFAMAPRCQWCGRSVPTGLHPHHVFSRGAGRLDIRINLIPLCPPFVGNNCHGLVHAGEIMRCDLLAVVAAREDVAQDKIEEYVHLLRRTPKGTEMPECAGCGREFVPLRGGRCERCWSLAPVVRGEVR